MAIEVEQPSQPASTAAEIVRKTFADYAPEPDAPQAPTEEAAPIETFDPATIKIPNRQFVTNVPKALEKFKDKTLVDFANSYEEAERGFHSKAQEAAQARRENEELRSRLAAAEQFARMSQAPQVQQSDDPYQRAGVNVDEAIITDPRRVLNIARDEADRNAQTRADAAAQKALSEMRAEFTQKSEEAQLITAFELARSDVAKTIGRDVTVEEWQNDLQDIARIVHARTPERKFDHNAYVETYVRLRGVPKVSVPTEGNPPLASRAASVRSEKQVPTMSREDQQLNKIIRRTLKLE